MSVFPDPTWRRSDNVLSGSTVFRRPLGMTELTFYWDTVFRGTAMVIVYLALEAEGAFGLEVFAKENIDLTWMRLKQRFPMLAASVEELPGSETVEFALNENALYSIRPGEVNIVEHLESAEDVTRLTDELLNGQPMLNNEIIARLWIGPQKDAPRKYHAFIAATHYITDGMAGATLMREFCQELASLSKENRVMKMPLAERLSGLLPLEALTPSKVLSRPQRRWRYAAAKIIRDLRKAKFLGGHTLPRIQQVAIDRPAHSQTTVIRLPASVTQQVISTCRGHGITFGNALPVLSQLAHTRVLHRRRDRRINHRQPKISDEEWKYRRTQPMYFPGPINLRPYLDRSWYESGGATDVCTAIGFSDIVLPSMPSPKPLWAELSSLSLAQQQPLSLARWFEGPRDVGVFVSDGPPINSGESDEFYDTVGITTGSCSTSISSAEDGTPSFSALLSQQQFLARASIVLEQSAAQLRHPLLQELQAARMPELCRRTRALGLAWRAKQAGQDITKNTNVSAPGTDSETGGFVMSNGGASLGNRDLIFPLKYPLGPASAPRAVSASACLHVRDSVIHLRCRPGELYLGALTTRGELTLFSYADTNIYDPDVVREWMEDVRAATVHYLGTGRDNDGALMKSRL